MVTREVNIKCKNGIHLRPAGILSGEALKFKCTINIVKGNKTHNVKSVLSLLGSCTKYGEKITICCDGPDEEEALDVVTKFLAEME